MIFKYELRFLAFTWPNLCLLFIMLLGRNFVSGICELKPKKPKTAMRGTKGQGALCCWEKEIEALGAQLYNGAGRGGRGGAGRGGAGPMRCFLQNLKLRR